MSAVTLGMELTRCNSVLMKVEGRESLPIVPGVDTMGMPSGPYAMLRAFHRRSISHASLAFTEEKSAAECSSELGRVAAAAEERRSRSGAGPEDVVAGGMLVLAILDDRLSSATLDLLTLRRGETGVCVDRTDTLECCVSLDGCLL